MTELDIIRVFREKGNCVVTILPDRVTGKFRFVNLTSGHICKCEFDTVEDAVRDLEEYYNNGKIQGYIDSIIKI